MRRQITWGKTGAGEMKARKALRRGRTGLGFVVLLAAGLLSAGALGNSGYAFILGSSGSETDTGFSSLAAEPTISSDQPDYSAWVDRNAHRPRIGRRSRMCTSSSTMTRAKSGLTAPTPRRISLATLRFTSTPDRIRCDLLRRPRLVPFREPRRRLLPTGMSNSTHLSQHKSSNRSSTMPDELSGWRFVEGRFSED